VTDVARAGEFPAGLVLDAHKARALAEPLAEVPVPRRLRFALDQGSGHELRPAVATGDAVAIGTVLGVPFDEFAAPVHSSVSGRVVAVGVMEAAADGGLCTCIDVENDGLDTRDASLRAPEPAAQLEPQTLVVQLRQAGIAGLGGAAFPTATKLQAARARGARRLLLNGAECEPWICCDDALMRTQADDVVMGARILMHALEAQSCDVAIEDDKPEAIAAVRAALDCAADSRLQIVVIPAVYPQGAERQLVTAVTGLEVPAGGLPADVGVTCQNVGTAAAVARWARTGEPLVSRIVTVTGSGVAQPRNVRARIGTPLRAMIEAAGGYSGEPLRLVAGGSMTGRALATDEVGLGKAVNCVLVATRADFASRLLAQEVACIRCGDCASACPAGLLPQEIHRAVVAGNDDAAVHLGVFDCIDCGCCDFVCPSQIPLAARFRDGRQRVRQRDLAALRAAAAKSRYETREARLREAAAAERRAFDDARERARGGDGPAPGGPA
jgi:electron transport complex protein RnfC